MTMPRYFDSLVELDDADDFCSGFEPGRVDDEVQDHHTNHNRTASTTSVLTDGYDDLGPYGRYSHADSYQAKYFDPSLMEDYDPAPTTSTTPDTKDSAATIFSDKSTKSSRSSRSSRSSKQATKPAAKSAKVVVKVEEVTTPKLPPKKKSKKGTGRKEPEVQALEEENSKRSKFLERNRVAASKCRQKKKEWMNDLEETKSGLESTNQALQREYAGLIGEVSRMKDQLMGHANCNDANIDKWLENEARRFVHQTSQRYDHGYVAGYTSPSTSGSVYPGNFSSSRPGTTWALAQGAPRVAGADSGLIDPTVSAQAQLSPSVTEFSLVTSPRARGSMDMNYDHMPDIMFEVDGQGEGS